MNFDPLNEFELADLARVIKSFQEEGVSFTLTYEDRIITLRVS